MAKISPLRQRMIEDMTIRNGARGWLKIGGAWANRVNFGSIS